MTRALRDESGMTLIELMIGTMIGLIVIGAAYTILVAATPLSARTQDRVDAYQRGRLAMDVMASELRSQVCLPNTSGNIIPPIIPTSSTANEVWFYSNTGNISALAQKRRIYLSGNALKEDVWQGTGTLAAPTFAVNPTSTRTLISPVGLVSGVPLFSYYGFDSNLPASVNQLLSAPVSAADSQKVVQVDISFIARPSNATAASPRDTTFQESVFFRTADPTDPAKGPKCD
jgi:prepilin-type N-terminal cleavage/methylation domain-containing protein